MAVTAALLSILLYRQALGFAFFNDDPTGHFAWMEGKAWWQFFLTSADYGYYRPIVFVTLRLLERLAGGFNSVVFHALLLGLHGLNTALAWWLAFVLGGRQPIYAWVAALVFATAPFSYEAVIYVASLTHPLLVCWLLVTLLFYRLGQQRQQRESRLLQTAAFATLLLGLLSHENGLLIPIALAGMVWVTDRSSLSALFKRLWPYFIPPLLYLPLWFSIPKEGEQSLATLGNLASNAIPFLQTVVYPLLPLLNLEAADTLWLLVLTAAVTGGLGLLAYWAGRWRLWLFALGWTAATALPAILFLSPDYLYGSPRLHYLPTIGVALLWGLPILWIGQRLTTRASASHSQFTIHKRCTHCPLFTILSILYALALLIPPLSFIRCQVDFYAQTSTIVRQMAAHAADTPNGRAITFVNLPFFFSSYAAHPDGCPNPYSWTPIGAVVIPPYAQAQDFVRFNGGPNRPVRGITYEGYTPGWVTFGPTLAADDLRATVEETAVYVFDLPSGAFFDLSAMWQPNESAEAEPLASFGEIADLLHAEVTTDEAQMTVRLRWQIREPTVEPLTAFVHFYAPNGVLLAQHDGPLAEGFVTAELWRRGDIIEETRLLTVPLPLPELGEYPVAVGLYNSLNGERLAATAEGRPLPDNVYIVATVSLLSEN